MSGVCTAAAQRPNDHLIGLAPEAMIHVRKGQREYPMRIFPLVAIVAMLAGPAYAQDAPHVNLAPEVVTRSPEEKAADEERDKAYRESLRKIPDSKSSSDPWGGVRSADAPRTTVKSPAKPKTKTGSNVN
jgi:hypothetical protein